MNQPLKGQVRLYACGGGGLNIGQRLQGRGDGGFKTEVGFAQLSTVYIDTSRSNLRDGVDEASVYLIAGLDGSGKVRSENHMAIGEHMDAILQKFPPMDLNIVLSTAAGGSGSVIAPLIVSELLLQDKPVVVVCVGSAASQLDAENSLKTLKSYEAVSKKRKAPVAMYYVQNSAQMRREQADVLASEAIIALCLLFSREHRELDSRDLRNWLRFNEKVTSYPEQVACLSLIEKESDFSTQAIGNIISVATLAQEGSPTEVTPPPPYQATGFLVEGVSEKACNRMPMHYVLSDGFIAGAAKKFAQLLSELNATHEAALRQSENRLLDSKDVATDDGLVL